jgi:hypothetical protein
VHARKGEKPPGEKLLTLTPVSDDVEIEKMSPASQANYRERHLQDSFNSTQQWKSDMNGRHDADDALCGLALAENGLESNGLRAKALFIHCDIVVSFAREL